MPARKPKTKPQPKATTTESYVDKVIGLIKWVDNPFKLFTVIVIASLSLIGYMTWESRQVILAAITSSHATPMLQNENDLLEISQHLIKDTDAEAVVIHQANLMVNTRTTKIAVDKTGRNKDVEGVVTSIFNENPNRNKAVVAMLAGEVMCDKLVPSSKIGEWFKKHEVNFVCRGSIPPEIGKFVGYVTLGFKEEPKDITSIKSILQQASTKMAK